MRAKLARMQEGRDGKAGELDKGPCPALHPPPFSPKPSRDGEWSGRSSCSVSCVTP